MFDPYHKWLRIPPQEQPPNHYRLLGLEVVRIDPEVIDAAANRQMAYIQQLAGETWRFVAEITQRTIRRTLVLLDQKKKTHYDAELRRNKR